MEKEIKCEEYNEAIAYFMKAIGDYIRAKTGLTTVDTRNLVFVSNPYYIRLMVRYTIPVVFVKNQKTELYPVLMESFINMDNEIETFFFRPNTDKIMYVIKILCKDNKIGIIEKDMTLEQKEREAIDIALAYPSTDFEKIVSIMKRIAIAVRVVLAKFSGQKEENENELLKEVKYIEKCLLLD